MTASRSARRSPARTSSTAGDYSAGLTLSAAQLTNVEVVALLPAPNASYAITTVDNLVPAGGKLRFFGSTLEAGQNFTFNGAAETDGSLILYGGLGADVITTGSGNDAVYFGQGRFDPLVDRVDGGGGTRDEFALDGTYALSLGGAQLQNIEVIALLDGRPGINNSYTVTLLDTLLTGTQSMTVWAAALRSGATIDAGGETGAGNAFTIYGGGGADTLTGGAGGDRLTGNGGSDGLTGNGGADRFVFEGVVPLGAANVDTISDFNSADGDRIHLQTALFTALSTSGLSAAAFRSGAGATAASTADHRIIYDTISGALYYDPDGADGAAAVQFAVLTNAPPLQHTDFLVF
jgi:Ca2+-binding RTX toxin-like protein